jgi:glutaconate CoA-transferase subunit B
MALAPRFRGGDDGNGGALARMNAGPAAYTASELLAVMSARLLGDGQVVFAGVGIPLLAATLAQRLHAPGLTILFEGGVIGAFIEPGKLPPSTNEQRCTRRANMVLSSTDVLLLLQRGYVDIGFMGGAQIDQYGNLNSSFIGEPRGATGHPVTRLPGTGGGNDIASLTRMIVAMKHEKRRFVSRVDFVTSPGFLSGEESRRDAGLITGGIYRVVTDLGIFGFDEHSKRMQLHALHPGITADRVQESTGFELLVAPDLPVTDPPTEDELAALRHLDPDRLYTA